MSDIKSIISKICPSVTFEEGDGLLVNVPEKDWYPLAKQLKENKQLNFDVLSAVVGMDWKDSIGVIYYLTSTSNNWDVTAFKVLAENRENPTIHSVADLWKVANFQEREVFDFYGIKFINHPDMRRFFLRNDWVGYPSEKITTQILSSIRSV